MRAFINATTSNFDTPTPNGLCRFCRATGPAFYLRFHKIGHLMSLLSQQDPNVARAIQLEDGCQQDCVVLIASENYASKAALERRLRN